MSNRFDKFTAGAKQVLVLAHQEAQCFNHTYSGTEHLLLGLVREEAGRALTVLREPGAEPDQVRGAAEASVGRGDRMPGLRPLRLALTRRAAQRGAGGVRCSLRRRVGA